MFTFSTQELERTHELLSGYGASEVVRPPSETAQVPTEKVPIVSTLIKHAGLSSRDFRKIAIRFLVLVLAIVIVSGITSRLMLLAIIPIL